MAPHSSTLAWKIPWTEKPGRLQSLGSLESDTLSDFTFTFMHWRRKWQPTPVFLPGESHGRRNLVGCSPWGAMQEILVQFLGWEDPLEKGTSTHSSILAWRIPWTIQSMGSQRVRHN